MGHCNSHSIFKMFFTSCQKGYRTKDCIYFLSPTNLWFLFSIYIPISFYAYITKTVPKVFFFFFFFSVWFQRARLITMFISNVCIKMKKKEENLGSDETIAIWRVDMEDEEEEKKIFKDTRYPLRWKQK